MSVIEVKTRDNTVICACDESCFVDGTKDQCVCGGMNRGVGLLVASINTNARKKRLIATWRNENDPRATLFFAFAKPVQLVLFDEVAA